MAIRRMTDASRANLPNVETVRNYHGHEADRVQHGRGWAADGREIRCPLDNGVADMSGRLSPECPTIVSSRLNVDGTREPYSYCPCRVLGPLYMETTHVGLVLRVWEQNGRDDSDFYAEVWNPETGRPESIQYASTRGWTYPNGATVDATPEVLAAYAAWCQRVDAERRAAEAAREAATPRFGKTVRVVKGRKVPVGTVAEVFWTGRNGFNRSRWGRNEIERIGLRLPDGSKVFTDASNVEVVPS